MGGAALSDSNVRIRIKGRSGSVLRFFFVSVAFMMPWVLMTSMLGYYAYLFGNAILLEMNLAFYLPSIPVLILSGQVEKFLDARFGSTSSMAIRLLFGLSGFAVLTAVFPFIPQRSYPILMTLIALQGTMSAIAFSTAYQLVQNFRRADIIGLGIGGVGCGPIALILQLGLGVGPIPTRWQWITMFEVTSLFVIIGGISAASLFHQYWDVLSGKEQPGELANGDSATAPLLPVTGGRPFMRSSGGSQPATTVFIGCMDDDERREEERMHLETASSAFVFMTPDPFQGVPIFFRAPENYRLGHATDEDCPPVLRPRSKSYHTGMDAASHQKHSSERSYSFVADEHVEKLLGRVGTRTEPVTAPSGDLLHINVSHTHLPDEICCTDNGAHVTDNGAHVTDIGKPESDIDNPVSDMGKLVSYSGEPQSPGTVWGPSPFAPAAAKAFTPQSSPSAESVIEQADFTTVEVNALSVIPESYTGSVAGSNLSRAGSVRSKFDAKASVQGHASRVAARARGDCPPLTLAEETRLALAEIWPVLTSFLASVTTLYLVFPFFTYVPSSGYLGAALPRVLFFTRVGADMVGRFMPRRKAFLVHSPSVLVVLASWEVGVAVLLLLYIKAPVRFHHDFLSVGMVAFIWLVGGFINTMANIMAPAMVDSSLTGRASALMALVFQVGHFAGLLMAAVLVFVLYGEIGG